MNNGNKAYFISDKQKKNLSLAIVSVSLNMKVYTCIVTQKNVNDNASCTTSDI